MSHSPFDLHECLHLKFQPDTCLNTTENASIIIALYLLLMTWLEVNLIVTEINLTVGDWKMNVVKLNIRNILVLLN